MTITGCKMIFACIKNGVVENAIVADQKFADFIAPNWDSVVRVDNLNPQPGKDWAYDGETFTEPVQEVPSQPEEPP